MTLDQKTIINLKSQLEETGYANDEQFFGSYAFEHRCDEIFAALAAEGYTKDLTSRGKFFNEAGALYWFYDDEMITDDEAIDITKEWLKNVDDLSRQ